MQDKCKSLRTETFFISQTGKTKVGSNQPISPLKQSKVQIFGHKASPLFNSNWVSR